MPAINNQQNQIQRLNWLVAIHEISRDINSTIGLDQCLKAILDKTMHLLNVEMASLMLIDREKNELSIKYAKGLSEKIIKEAKAILNQPEPKEVAVWVAQRGEPLLIQDIEKDGRFLKRNGKKYTTNSLLSVPLKVKDQVIGVLNVNNKKAKRIFTQEDLDMLMTLANEVSIAIQNNRLYEELMAANERLKELDQLKSDFVANVSHELSTPLATSRYLLSVIEKGIAGEVTPKQKDYLVLIANNIDRLTRLIENLLSLSRIESGRFELKRESMEVVGIIKEALEPFKVAAAAKSVALKTALANNLPDIYIDKDRVVQVLVNLLDNAVKFTTDGGRVTVSAQILQKAPFIVDSELDFVQICVADSGVGIAQEDIDRLFVKFSRVPQKLDGMKVKGTGLGLAISREIIEAHRGKIWVESSPTEGSKFFFTLPAYNEEFFFIEYLNQQIEKASASKGSVSLLLFDLSKIKKLKKELTKEEITSVTDTIYKIARSDIRRPTDLVREFKEEARILVVAEADKAGAVALAERVLKDIRSHKVKNKSGKNVKLDVDTLALTFPGDGNTAKELLDRLNSITGSR